MTVKELEAALKSTGYPVAYVSFDEEPSLPYIAWTIPSERHHGSDFKNHIGALSVRVELYTNQKDPEAEAKIQKILSGVEFDKDETPIDNEYLFETIFEFTIYQKY